MFWKKEKAIENAAPETKEVVDLRSSDSSTKIEAVYNACVKFVEWYNAQKWMTTSMRKYLQKLYQAMMLN